MYIKCQGDPGNTGHLYQLYHQTAMRIAYESHELSNFKGYYYTTLPILPGNLTAIHSY